MILPERIDEINIEFKEILHGIAKRQSENIEQHGLKMVQIDSVPKPIKKEKIVSTILITFVDCVLNSRSGISQAYFPTWVKNIIGGYNISQWHWRGGKSNWGMQVYSTKPYTLSEAQEIKRKIENHSQNLSIKIELKTYEAQ